MISAKSPKITVVGANSWSSQTHHILPIWQPIGYSTYQIANSVSIKYRKKTTHTGVIDPMAEGVVIMLLDEERFNKMQHTAWLKEYEFEILFGISTDSHDGLGFATEVNLGNKITQESLEKILQKFVGPYAQKIPLYSAKKVFGRRLFMYPKLGMEAPELPIKLGRVHDLKLLDFKKVNLHDAIKNVISKVEQVKKGEFRQVEVTNKWTEFISQNADTQLVSAKVKVLITRGMYIRALCRDIGQKLESPAFVTSLVRTKNGPYAKLHCIDIDKMFGKNFNHDLLSSKYATLLKL